jgi:hypothetical protein
MASAASLPVSFTWSSDRSRPVQPRTSPPASAEEEEEHAYAEPPPVLKWAQWWRVVAADIVLGVVVVTFLLMSFTTALPTSNHRAAAVASPVVWTDANLTRDRYRANLRLRSVRWMARAALIFPVSCCTSLTPAAPLSHFRCTSLPLSLELIALYLHTQAYHQTEPSPIWFCRRRQRHH